MVQVNSLVAVFVTEGLVAAILLIAGFAVIITRRRARERDAAGRFISHVRQAQDGRSKRLEKVISEACDLEPGQLEAVLSEVGSCEKSLYRKVVEIFLNRDAGLLTGIDQNVQALTKPFLSLLSRVADKSRKDPEMAAAVEAARAEIERLKQESLRLSKQLSMAMETMDEISSEYSKIFGSSKQAEELDLSRKRMLNTYLRAEERMAKAFGDH